MRIRPFAPEKPAQDASLLQHVLVGDGYPARAFNAFSTTTLLQRMLDAHPDLAVANDSHFILETLADFAPLDPLSGIDLDPALTRDLVEWVRTYRTFGRLGLDDRAVVMRTLAVASDTLSIRQIARSFAQGKAVEKRVALTILALARLGHVASPDGGDTLVLRRVA